MNAVSECGHPWMNEEGDKCAFCDDPYTTNCPVCGQKVCDEHNDGVIKSFDTFGEMFEHMTMIEEAARKRITPAQWNIADGKKHYFVRPYEQYGELLFIWGWTWDLEKESEKIHSLPDEDKDEAVYELRMLENNLKAGRVFTRSFSQVEPQGELGSQHVSTLIEISEERFLMAQENDWRIW